MTMYLNSETVEKVILFGGLKVAFFCFKQLPLNKNLNLRTT